VLLAVALVWLYWPELRSVVLEIKAWVADRGALGWVVFAVGFVVLSTLTVPDSIMCIAAGALFGFPSALALVLVSATSGRVVQFGLARVAFRRRVLRFVEDRPRLTRITRAVLRDQVRLQLMIRLTPMSFTLTSYVFSAIGVRFGGYLIALAGTLPLHLVMIYIGAEGASVAEMSAMDGGGWGARVAVEVAGLAASVVALMLVTRVAVREVRRASAEPE
jgi:uncharacterized membrane protein YdjX (TVP38/TMEM64 family)